MRSLCFVCVDQEREELKQRERRKRRTRLEVISILTQLGYSRRDAARAAHLADGDVDKACEVSHISGSLETFSFSTAGNMLMSNHLENMSTLDIELMLTNSMKIHPLRSSSLVFLCSDSPGLQPVCSVQQ